MQQVLAVLVLTFVLLGCVRNKSIGQNSFDKKETTETIWYVDYETPHSNGILKRSKSLNAFDKKTGKLIREINLKYPKIGLEFMKISYDTIFVNVKNSDVLTEKMGTAGSDEIIAVTKFTLTELEAIHKVYFNMIDGSHAGKGVRTRNSFTTIFENE